MVTQENSFLRILPSNKLSLPAALYSISPFLSAFQRASQKVVLYTGVVIDSS